MASKTREPTGQLKNGPNCSTKNLLATEICEIIKAAAEAGVCSLKYGSLSVSFFSSSLPERRGEEKTFPAAVAINQKEQHHKEDDIAPNLVALVKQAALERLMIEDPAEYEEWATSEDAEVIKYGSEQTDSEA